MMVSRNINRAKKPVAESTVSKAVANKKLQEKAARAESAARVWDNHPLFKGELSKIKEAKVRQNAAINLTNQARYMKQLNEQETSSEFQKMAPANMMRLVQLTMTNLNRGNCFSEYAMETARDAIYYIKPFFSKSIGDPNNLFANRHSKFDGTPGQDPYELGDAAHEELKVGGYNGQYPAYGGQKRANNNYAGRKAVYETVESRFANELANVEGISGIDSFDWVGGPFGTASEGYVPGYSKIYTDTDERKLVAIQDSNTLQYFPATEFAGLVITEAPRDNVSGVVTVTLDWTNVDASVTKPTAINAYGRFVSETDYEGKHLGEVDLQVTVHELRPQRTSIGVSWTKLAEITLDASFNTQVDDILLASAADTIHQQMDYQAFKDAYAFARTNPKTYTVHFDAAYSTAGASTATGNKDSYRDNAQTLSSAIELASAALYSDIKRGTINNMVVGLSVAPYIKLNNGFEPKGLQDATGVYKIGELDGIPVYKAPIEVIPDNEILCIYKNNKVENDVAIVYGTLVPFVSNKLEYPTFYTRAGLATFGDRAVLNRKYLARIVIDNLKDRFKEEDYFDAA